MTFRRTSGSSDALSLFKEQPSVFVRALAVSIFALCLMVIDTRLKLVDGVRQGVAVVITPIERLAQKPLIWLQAGYDYLGGVGQARIEEDAARVKLATNALRAALVEDLMIENQRLKDLLELRGSRDFEGKAARVLYDLPAPHTQKLVIDRGRAHGIKEGSPVLDEHGVLGQVTRLLPFTSEVTLLVDNQFTVSVVIARTGIFGVVHGVPTRMSKKITGSLELQFIPADADVREGDLLITSGIDGIFPPGLPVGQVEEISHDPSSLFAAIWATPIAELHNARYVMTVVPEHERLMSEAQEQIEKTPLEEGSEPALQRPSVE